VIILMINAANVVVSQTNWYDTLIVGMLALTFLLKATLIRREGMFGWIMCWQALVFVALWSWAFLRRLYPWLDEWPLSVLKAVLLVSCIMACSALIYEKILVMRLGVSDPRKLLWRREGVVLRREKAATRREDVVTRREDCMDKHDTQEHASQ
jgi:hypothetical protein